MQGFILSIRAIKNQDLILRILTPHSILELYRFYGMRHSILSVGKKIDFDVQNNGIFMSKLRNVAELNFSWEREYIRAYVWAIFIRSLADHLRDIVEVEPFYFELLEKGGICLKKQNPMRVVLEMSSRLIVYEGRNARLHHNRCFVCNGRLDERVSLGRAFLFAHPECIGGDHFEKSKLLDFLDSSSTIHLDDSEIERLWSIFSLGL
ncbi:recombination protein RecO [Helicobacter kayseriensis]|uniref:recombination protein RecO n=1 Tax=Helicobacter kayseriensis TaxID=2905877 RepID=UPI001E3126F5|nr:recombination protein RecO [Helicobacter kayseriensis]MCE3047768.1 recombination protein RecO [Helicobacter kayseriensis]MCE3049133.1 recombination protein RecO [Helicobacter kayseriensis]